MLKITAILLVLISLLIISQHNPVVGFYYAILLLFCIINQNILSL